MPEDELADGHVLADAEAHLDAGGFERVGHAAEHLDFDRVPREAGGFELRQGGGDGPARCASPAGERRPVRRPVFLGPGVDEHGGHALEAGVGLAFARPDRKHGPAQRLGVGQLVVPVSALDEADGDAAAACGGTRR